MMHGVWSAVTSGNDVVKYDLILKNGHVLDPDQGVDGRMDIAVAGGLITDFGESIAEGDADEVIDVEAPGRYVVPGLIDIHTHVAFGATTIGVGATCCDPDDAGVTSGVTTVADAGSVGIANFGAFPAHILPKARTRVLCYLNAGTFAHTIKGRADVCEFSDVDAEGIRNCIDSNPGYVQGIKLRLLGPFMAKAGEEVIRSVKGMCRDVKMPLMVHIGDRFASIEHEGNRLADVTGFLLSELDHGDIVTHLCTPNVGGVGEWMDGAIHAARKRGVTMDAALGMGNFGYRVAREQFGRGLYPDTISSDLTAAGQRFQSLVECMAKFLAIGYNLKQVVRMTTSNAAKAIGVADVTGAISSGMDADLTVLDVVEGNFLFRDTRGEEFRGRQGIRPVLTVRAGRPVLPRWGTHPWGWLPQNVLNNS